MIESNSTLVNHNETKTPLKATWRDYLALCKLRVVSLILLTAIVGMYLATPGSVPLHILILATLGIGLAASSAAAINHVWDRHIDAMMARTKRRPLPAQTISAKQALLFASILGITGIALLYWWINPLTAILTLVSLLGYAVFYTIYLKRATPQNIVIGGIAGAAPPLLGWTAVTGYFVPESLLLVLIIYTWTPPHFWALAIYRYDDYAKAEIPMLPVTHGIEFTKLYILLYTILLIAASILPFAVGMSGWLYGLSALILGGIFLYWAIRLKRTKQARIAKQTFDYSILYLLLLFVFLLIDHWWIK